MTKYAKGRDGIAARLPYAVGPGWFTVYLLADGQLLIDYVSEVDGSMPKELGRCANPFGDNPKPCNPEVEK